MLLTITLILACIAMTTAVVAIAILLSPVGTLGLKSKTTEKFCLTNSSAETFRKSN